MSFSNNSKIEELGIKEASKIEYVEETLINIVDNTLKSLKIEIKNSEIKILSDNHLYQFLDITSSQIIFSQKNNFNYYFDNSKIKLLKGFSELKIQDLIFYSSPDKIMLELPSFNIGITSDISYSHISKEAQINNFLNSDVNFFHLL